MHQFQNERDTKIERDATMCVKELLKDGPQIKKARSRGRSELAEGRAIKKLTFKQVFSRGNNNHKKD
jgi:hypothetical protein